MGDTDDKLSKDFQEKPTWTDSGVCVDSGLCIDLPSLPSTLDVDNPFKQDAEGDTILHLAVIQGVTNLVSYLIKEAPSSEYLDIANDEFQTPLHLATITKQYGIINQLVTSGASLFIRDRNGNSPVHIACQNGDIMALKSLLSAKPRITSDINSSSCSSTTSTSSSSSSSTSTSTSLSQSSIASPLNLKNYEGETSLHLAVKTADKSLIEYLVNHGADINAQEGKSGKTVLHYAILQQKLDLIQFLIYNCKCSPHVRTYGGLTAMHFLRGLLEVNPNSGKLRAIYQILQDCGVDCENYSSTNYDSDIDYYSGQESDEDIL
ncbi:NF-kappa-B inhibitor cactus-like [Panonychus citri]|uniref:NF-kappa-B inhibitor cactus-like n=1 Tax=Panonychus citri TaxID=50023 RepID=UPI0023075BB2|nr:NF-kappa-B inhibitor cactus-like [Panonychus citri]